MFFDDRGRLSLSHLYPSDKAIHLPLTKRGFFSEFNAILSFYALALMEGRHVFTDVDAMNVAWGDLFDYLPVDSGELRKPPYSVRTRVTLKSGREEWMRMLDVLQAAQDRPSVKVRRIGLNESLERLLSRLAKAAFRPKPEIDKQAKRHMAALGLEDQKFYAVHIRAGDKVYGDPLQLAKLGRYEGEYVTHDRFMTPILAESASPKVFVLTDDYGEVELLRTAYPQADVVTLCPTENRGYMQRLYSEQDAEKRTADVRGLLVEVLIANRAKVFFGPYRSNVARFVHLLRYPRPPFSVARQRLWKAG